MTMNLRCDNTFVQDEGWYAACSRYEDFLRRHEGANVVYLELGVGGNTPVIIKYPFWKMTYQNAKAFYACINLSETYCPTDRRHPAERHSPRQWDDRRTIPLFRSHPTGGE